MAAITPIVAFVNNNQSDTTSTSLVDPSNPCTTSALANGITYLVLYRASFNNANSNDLTEVVLDFGGTVYARTVAEIGGTMGHGGILAGLVVLTGNGTSTVKFQFRSVGGNTARIDFMSIVCIPLTDLTQNTNYWYSLGANSDTASNTNLTDWTTIQSVTLTTVSSRKYLVIGSVEVAPDSANASRGGRARLTVDGSAQSYEALIESEDATDWRSYSFASIVTGTGSSQTFAVQANGRGDANEDARRGRIFVLDTTAFATGEITNQVDNTGVSISAGGGNQEWTALTTSTARSAGKFILLGTFTAGSDNANFNAGWYLRNSSNTAVLGATIYAAPSLVENDPGFDSARDQVPEFVLYCDTSGSITGNDYDIYVWGSSFYDVAYGRNPANSAGVKSELILWGLELASTGTTYPITLASIGKGVTTNKRTTVKALPSTGRGSTTLKRSTSRTFAAIGEAVAAVAKTIDKTFASIGKGVTTFVGLRIKAITLAAVGRGVTATTRTTIKALAATGRGLASVSKVIDTSYSAVGKSATTLVNTIVKSLPAVGNGLTTLTRSTSRTYAAVGKGVAALSKVIQKPLAATGQGLSALSRSIAKTLAAVGKGVTSGTFLRVRVITLNAVGRGSAGMTRTLDKTLAAVGKGLSTATKTIVKPLAAVGKGITSLTRTAVKALAAAGRGTAALSKSIDRTYAAVGRGIGGATKLIIKPLAAVGKGLTTWAYNLIPGGGGTLHEITLAAIGRGAAVISRSTSRTYAAIGKGAAGLANLTGKTLAAVGKGTTTAAFLRTAYVTLNAIGVGTATVARSTSKTFAATGRAITGMTKLIAKTFAAIGKGIMTFIGNLIGDTFPVLAVETAPTAYTAAASDPTVYLATGADPVAYTAAESSPVLYNVTETSPVVYTAVESTRTNT